MGLLKFEAVARTPSRKTFPPPAMVVMISGLTIATSLGVLTGDTEFEGANVVWSVGADVGAGVGANVRASMYLTRLAS